jgi:ATP-dependent Lon protease
VSVLSNRAIKRNVAMTGEVTLRGNVLAIGGLKEKVLAAHRNKITTVIIPLTNKKDIEDIPKEVAKEVEFVYADHVKQVLKVALVN